MGKHIKKKRLSIEHTTETISPDITKEQKDNNTKKDDKEDKGCKCCGVLDCFKIEKQTNNNINGNNNVIDNNKEVSLSLGLNKK